VGFIINNPTNKLFPKEEFMGWADELIVVAPDRVAQNFILFSLAFCFMPKTMGTILGKACTVPAITKKKTNLDLRLKQLKEL
jgi:hypothetical protein